VLATAALGCWAKLTASDCTHDRVPHLVRLREGTIAQSLRYKEHCDHPVPPKRWTQPMRRGTPVLQIECTSSVRRGVLHYRNTTIHRADQPRGPWSHHKRRETTTLCTLTQSLPLPTDSKSLCSLEMSCRAVLDRYCDGAADRFKVCTLLCRDGYCASLRTQKKICVNDHE
jgi:hypothetical protein